MLPLWSIYVIMVVCALLMIWANQQYNTKGVGWGRPVAGLFGVLALASAIFAIFVSIKGPSMANKGLQEKENVYQRIAMKTIGAELARTCPGAKALLLLTPTHEYNKTRQEATIAGLTEGFQGKLAITEKEEVGGNAEMVMEQFLSAKDFDGFIKRYPNCNLIISLIGLPYDYAEMKFWKMEKDRPKLVTTAVNLADEQIQEAIADGKLNVVLSSNPNNPYNFKDPVPANEKDAFDKRFILITPENIEQMVKDYPKLFGK